MENSRRLFISTLLASTPLLAAAHHADLDGDAGPSLTLGLGGLLARPLVIGAADTAAWANHVPAHLDVRNHDGVVVRQLDGYTGVRLRDLLDRAGIADLAHEAQKRTVVVARATDGYAALFSWSELYNSGIGEGVYVLSGCKGLALDDREGRFALFSACDQRSGPRYVRRLAEIELRGLV